MSIIKGWVVKVVASHHGPQLDEWLAYWLAYKFGRKTFLGIREAEFRFYDAGRYTPDGRPASAWEAEGYLPLGIWYATCDEHGLPLEEQTAGACAATLMAKLLDLDDIQQEAVAQMVQFASNNDSKGHSTPFDLAALIKDLNAHMAFQGRMAARNNRSFPVQAQIKETRRILFALFEAKYHEQYNFMKAKNWLMSKAKDPNVWRESVDCADGVERLLMTFSSPNSQAARAARALRPRPTIVIQRGVGGQVAILGSGSVPLAAVADRIIQEECRRGASHEAAERCWYYFNRNNANQLLNGGLSAPNVPGTRVPLDFIHREVARALRGWVAPASVRRREEHPAHA